MHTFICSNHTLTHTHTRAHTSTHTHKNTQKQHTWTQALSTQISVYVNWSHVTHRTIHAHIHIHTNKFIYMYIYIYIHVYTYIHIYIYIFIYIYILTNTHTYICIHKYTSHHTHIIEARHTVMSCIWIRPITILQFPLARFCSCVRGQNSFERKPRLPPPALCLQYPPGRNSQKSDHHPIDYRKWLWSWRSRIFTRRKFPLLLSMPVSGLSLSVCPSWLNGGSSSCNTIFPA